MEDSKRLLSHSNSSGVRIEERTRLEAPKFLDVERLPIRPVYHTKQMSRCRGSLIASSAISTRRVVHGSTSTCFTCAVHPFVETAYSLLQSHRCRTGYSPRHPDENPQRRLH